MVRTEMKQMAYKKQGQVFSLVHDNRPLPGCTISRRIYEDDSLYILLFSLGKGTDISDTAYGQSHFFYGLSGTAMIRQGEEQALTEGDAFISKPLVPLSVSAPEDTVYLEIGLKKEDKTMNTVINEKGVFQLKDLVPYGEEQIINKGLIENDKVRFAVISLAKDSTLPDHAAPRDALLFALDGEAVFTHEGKDYVFKAGDNFAMKKGDRHHLKATTNFKFALLLTEPEA